MPLLIPFLLSLWNSCIRRDFLSRIQPLISNGLLGSISFAKFDCISCHLGKQTALHFHNNTSTSKLVHSNV